ncbi:unnamed protein product, partial [marine sediment metagenome]
TQALIEAEADLSPDLKEALDQLLYVTKLMLDRLTLNSSNSSIPPASDPNRQKNSNNENDESEPTSNNPGGQFGHPGKTLDFFERPNHVINLSVDHALMRDGHAYKSCGYLRRQVVDIKIQRVITEYRAEILEDQDGNQLVADFPDKVKRQVQYGDSIKAQAIYLSQFQLIPYERVADYFRDQAQIPLSTGSVYNFNEQMYHVLQRFEDWVKRQLLTAFLAHVDETSININGKKHWLHVICTKNVTFLFPHETRGLEANHAMGVLPFFNGILCHDHWKAYFQFGSGHVLCNAHHLRELERAKEQDQQYWADILQTFLIELNTQVKENGGALNQEQADAARKEYRDLLREGETECPPPDEDKVKQKGKRGPVKRSKARNLLERLINYEDEVLRFMTDERIPYTNNQGESDLRMSKVQQKISGCFRSMQGAYNFARVRSYITTWITAPYGRG